tara:strand:+ start:498 stop:719 length:222 start_codon:yes stop_codon:yes gene_type:complete
MKEISYTSLAMDLSSGMFAYHIFGVMKAVSEGFGTCPNPEFEARSYLITFHGEALAEAEEAHKNNSTPNHLLS